jgi:hypothetical protein
MKLTVGKAKDSSAMAMAIIKTRQAKNFILE